MEHKVIQMKIQGMHQDIGISSEKNNYAYEMMNIRIEPNTEDTGFILTNEKGNTKILGGFDTYMGHCVLNDTIILFTHSNLKDNIIEIEFKNSQWIKTILWSGNLNLNPIHKIETIGLYESDNIQKVYWIDGINPLRYVNIKDPKISSYSVSRFNATPEMKADATVTIQNVPTEGLFSPGTVQYIATYFYKNGAQSNPFYISSIYYTYKLHSDIYDRGGKPDEGVMSNSFSIKLENLDTNFEYVRLYSVVRNSQNSTPVAKVVFEKKINYHVIDNEKKSNIIEFIDTNIGYNIDPFEILYAGGINTIPQTFEHKDQTLFLGNLTIKKDILQPDIFLYSEEGISPITFVNDSASNSTFITKTFQQNVENSIYPYNIQLDKSLSEITTFKYDEAYKLGIQLQDKWGNWSNIIPVKHIDSNNQTIDYYINNIKPNGDKTYIKGNLKLNTNVFFYKNYIAYRPVIAYPPVGRRKVLAQGILCPTVFKYADRKNKNCYGMASWFSRPNFYAPDNKFDTFSSEHNRSTFNLLRQDENGKYIKKIGKDTEGGYFESSNYEYNKGCEFEGWDKYYTLSNLEIKPYNCESPGNDSYSDGYYIDKNLVTLHSPELEFDTIVQSIDPSNYKLRIIGKCPITSHYGKWDIIGKFHNSVKKFDNGANGKDPTWTYGNDSNQAIVRNLIQIPNALNSYKNAYKSLGTDAIWKDYPTVATPSKGFEVGDTGDVISSYYDTWYEIQHYFVYPFNIGNHLSNAKNSLDSKLLFNLNFSHNNDYLALKDFQSYEIKDCKATFNQNVILTDNNQQKVYKSYGDVVWKPSNTNNIFWSLLSDNKTIIGSNIKCKNKIGNNRDYILDEHELDDMGVASYKTTLHYVIDLGKDKNNNQIVLPEINNTIYNEYDYTSGTFWDPNIKGISCNQINNSLGRINFGYFWLAELYQDVENPFEFINSDDVEWVIGGPTKTLVYDKNTINPEIILKPEWTEGDTYFQRYDHVKTFPYSKDSKQNIVDVVSFMVESHINLDGRCDKNRGYHNIFLNDYGTNGKNFNQMNLAYTQPNNFFTYREQSSLSNTTNQLYNQITWSLTKEYGELIDKWCNVNLISTLDMDGDKGSVRALKRFNNNLYCFQDKSISAIAFNERTAIATTNGVPLELANTGKVTGKQYLTNNTGCVNKWSICEGGNGLYFVDDLNKSINILGEGITNISTQKGFRTWMENVGLENCKTFYDRKKNDVYFISPTHCLNFSEYLNEFQSFYSYENTDAMFNYKDKLLSFYNNDLYEQFTGDYNRIYDTYKPYSISYRINPDGITDKIFTNLEWRHYLYDINNTIVENKTWDNYHTYNDYQDTGIETDYKKRFNIWHAIIGRDKINKRDRIRNPWTKIKLSHLTEDNYKSEMHDLIVHYYQ